MAAGNQENHGRRAKPPGNFAERQRSLMRQRKAQLIETPADTTEQPLAPDRLTLLGIFRKREAEDAALEK